MADSKTAAPSTAGKGGFSFDQRVYDNWAAKGQTAQDQIKFDAWDRKTKAGKTVQDGVQEIRIAVASLEANFPNDIRMLKEWVKTFKHSTASDGGTRTDIYEDLYMLSTLASNGDTSAENCIIYIVARAMGVGKSWFDQKHGPGATDAMKGNMAAYGVHWSGVKPAYLTTILWS